MKNILLISLLSFFIGKSVAQDTIIKNSSEKIIAKILEISPTEVRYKKFDFQDGPTYIELKSDIQMVVYSNGSKEVFEQKKPEKVVVQVSDDVDYYSKTYATNGNSGKIEKYGSKKYTTQGKIINEKSMRTVLLESKDPKIMSLVDQSKRAQRRQFIWIASIPLAQIALIAATNIRPYDPLTQTYGPRNNGAAAVTAISFAGAIACPFISTNQKHKKKSTTAAAIKLYNQKF